MIAAMTAKNSNVMALREVNLADLTVFSFNFMYVFILLDSLLQIYTLFPNNVKGFAEITFFRVQCRHASVSRPDTAGGNAW